jgi:hypothetical protein
LSRKLGAMPLEVFGYYRKGIWKQRRQQPTRNPHHTNITIHTPCDVFQHLQYKFNRTVPNYTSGLSSGSKHVLSSFHKDHSELPLRTARHYGPTEHSPSYNDKRGAAQTASLSRRYGPPANNFPSTLSGVTAIIWVLQKCFKDVSVVNI